MYPLNVERVPAADVVPTAVSRANPLETGLADQLKCIDVEVDVLAERESEVAHLSIDQAFHLTGRTDDFIEQSCGIFYRPNIGMRSGVSTNLNARVG